MSADGHTEPANERGSDDCPVSIDVAGECVTLRHGDEFTGELRALGRIVITGCAFAEPRRQ